MSSHLAVVGAGWAGLAAALKLQEAGHRVTVLEVRHDPGGRARQILRPPFQAPLDNGQHILLGAYSATLQLMQELDCPPEQQFERLPLTLRTADGEFQLRAARLPSPWHALAGLLSAKGLSWQERLAAVGMMLRLRRRGWRVDGQPTVAEWLVQQGQPRSLITKLWAPLCLAALNTPYPRACAQLFARVLGDSLDAGAHASDLLLPRTDLSSLWPSAAASRLHVLYGRQARRLIPGTHDILLDGATYDGVVLAVPPYMAARLLSSLPAAGALIEQLNQFQYAPIATLTLQLSLPMQSLPTPMVMLKEDPARGHVGQWAFDRTSLFGLDPAKPELTVVSSQTEGLLETSRSVLTQRLHTQLAEQVALPPVAHAELIVEKRATFESVPGLQRPSNRTPWPRVVLAGDYTDTGYPAVLEGAVRSGLNAAKQLLQGLAV